MPVVDGFAVPKDGRPIGAALVAGIRGGIGIEPGFGVHGLRSLARTMGRPAAQAGAYECLSDWVATEWGTRGRESNGILEQRNGELGEGEATEWERLARIFHEQTEICGNFE